MSGAGTRRRTVASVVVGCVAIAGCTSSHGEGPRPTSATTTDTGARAGGDVVEIVWPWGPPDDTAWADEDAVAVLRRSDIAMALARYTHDWSEPDLVATTSASEYEPAYGGDLDGGVDALGDETTDLWRVEGPVPRVVIEVADGSDGETRVTSCVPLGWQERLADGEDLRQAPASVTVSILAERDGRLKVISSAWTSVDDGDPALGGARCDLSDLRYGYFTPERPSGYSYLRADVRPPHG